jgi:hypothetical protein
MYETFFTIQIFDNIFLIHIYCKYCYKLKHRYLPNDIFLLKINCRKRSVIQSNAQAGFGIGNFNFANGKRSTGVLLIIMSIGYQ